MRFGMTAAVDAASFSVDNPEDIRRIDCPGISGFCTVDAAGQVHYFKKTGGT